MTTEKVVDSKRIHGHSDIYYRAGDFDYLGPNMGNDGALFENRTLSTQHRIHGQMLAKPPKKSVGERRSPDTKSQLEEVLRINEAQKHEIEALKRENQQLRDELAATRIEFKAFLTAFYHV